MTSDLNIFDTFLAFSMVQFSWRLWLSMPSQGLSFVRAASASPLFTPKTPVSIFFTNSRQSPISSGLKSSSRRTRQFVIT